MPPALAAVPGWSAWYLMGVLGATLGALVWDRWRSDLVALTALLAVTVPGILDPTVAVLGFANPAVVAVAALFVLSAAIARTGALDPVARGLAAVGRGNATLALGTTLVAVMAASAFVNNTPVVVLFVPVMLRLAQEYRVSPSRLLLPLSYAGLLGGTCTLLGSSSNLLVNSLAAPAAPGAAPRFTPIGMFEMLPLGLVFCAGGLAYLLLAGPRWLPARRTVASLVRAHAARDFATEFEIEPQSPWVGRPPLEAVRDRHPAVRVLECIRGEAIHWPPFAGLQLEPGDVLMVRGPTDVLVDLGREPGLHLLPGLRAPGAEEAGREVTLAEGVVPPGSPLIGRTLTDLAFRRRIGAAVVAVQRGDTHVRSGIVSRPLATGDVLLFQADAPALEQLRAQVGLLLLEGAGRAVVDRRHAPIAGLVLMAVVVAAALGWLPMHVAALAGAVAVVATRCVPVREAYAAVHWEVIVMVGAMIGLGAAMETTGLAGWLAAAADAASAGVPPEWRPRVALALFLAVVAGVSNLLSNNATVVLFVPLALDTAAALGVDARPFLMAVAFGTATTLCLPAGYQTHLIVYGPGGYRVGDFVRFGLPLTVGLWFVAWIGIPWFWPFAP